MSHRITYHPGPWLALVRRGHLVLLPEGTDPGHVEDLWEALGANPSVETLLSAVLSARGLALTGMDPFGLVSLESDVHTILRGPVSLAAEGRELSTHVNGHGVTTWMERRIPRQESLDIALDDVLRKNDGGAPPWLPIVEGIVPFGRLHVELPEEQAGEIEPLSAPQPLVEPAAEPPGPSADAAPLTDAAPPAEPATAAPAPVDAAEAEAGPETESAPEPEPEPAVEPDPAVEPEPAAEPEPSPEPEPAPENASAPEPESSPEGRADNAPRPDNTPPSDGGDSGVSADDADDANTILSANAYSAVPAPAPEPPAPEPAAPEPAAQDEPVSDDTIAGPHTTDEDLPDPEELIDAVPWLAAARARNRADEQAGSPDAAPAADDQPTITSAPARGTTGHAASDAAGQPLEGDHDGDTVMRGDLPTQVLPTTPPAGGTGQDPATGPQVLARLCPAGHANPPTSSSCATCGAGLDGEPREVPRPSLGRMVISGGETVELDRPAVVGRQPSVSRSASGSMPRVVQVKSPSGDISRSHLEVQLEGWHVMLLDLKATNGTVLVRAGKPPRRLGQGEKLMLLDGDIADLGDGVSLRFEGLL